MGNFYVNHVAVGTDRDSIVAQLRDDGRKGYCSDAIGGNVYIYDQESDSQSGDVISKLGKSLSAALNCGVLAVLNHDDDILAIWSFESGDELDSYNSTPSYFEDVGEVQGGDANVIARVANAIGREPEIETVLRDTSYAFAFQRHWALAQVLDFDPNYCICGATSLDRQDVSPSIIDTILKIG